MEQFERTPTLRQVIHNLGTTSKSFITWELDTMSTPILNKIKESGQKITASPWHPKGRVALKLFLGEWELSPFPFSLPLSPTSPATSGVSPAPPHAILK